MGGDLIAERALDPGAAVEEIRRRPKPPRMPPVSLGLRVRTSRLRELVPTRLAVHRAERRGRALWARSAAVREDALAAMRTIVAATAREDELAELAEQRVIEEEVERALFWGRWAAPRVDVASRENLERARASGRGVIASVCHMGPAGPGRAALASRRTFYSTTASWFFEEPTRDYWGRRIARWHRGIYARRQRALDGSGSFGVLCRLLEEGELVLVQYDMPGSRETHFLGKPVMLTSGTVRLAFAADAVVLPMRNRREGHRVCVDILAALDPREHDGEQALHEALAELHERWILELPAALEDPRRPGAWESGATPLAWRRPQL